MCIAQKMQKLRGEIGKKDVSKLDVSIWRLPLFTWFGILSLKLQNTKAEI